MIFIEAFSCSKELIVTVAQVTAPLLFQT